MQKIYFLSGEDSGDLHAANLIKGMQSLDNELQFRGVGGDKMQARGMELVAHVRDINFMGFLEVIQNLGTIRRLFRTVEADILAWKPDVVVLIDYPGFNLRLAKWLHKQGIRVFYYISPQLWAWKKGRIEKVRAYIDRMYVILPFEKDFYAKEGIEVEFHGHPLLDAVADFTPTKPIEKQEKPLIAILPGSRTQEIKKMLPLMLKMTAYFPNYRFLIAGAPSKGAEFYQEMIGNSPAELRMKQTYPILSEAYAALVTSGTATLETALFNVPQVVCYKGSAISVWIAKRVANVKYISLVNLILDKLAVTELIQGDFHEKRLVEEVEMLLNIQTRKPILDNYAELHKKLGNVGASQRVAKSMLDRLKK